MAQIRIYLRFAWQAWHSWHGVARLGVVWARGDAAPFCVAGKAQPYIHFRFTWQVWHKLTSTLLSRARRGTNSHLPSFRVAGVAQTDIHLAFAWQAWHSWHGVARLGVVWARGDAAPFCVAGKAQPYIHFRFIHLTFAFQAWQAWQAWHSWHGVARLGVVWARGDAAPFCVAGVAQRYIHLRFTCRRGTNSHLPSFRVAGVALMAWGGALGCGLGAR